MTRLSYRVVEAVAREKAVSPESIPALYDAIDPDALDALFAPRPNAPGARRAGTVEFSYAGCDVTVDAGSQRVTVVESAIAPPASD